MQETDCTCLLDMQQCLVLLPQLVEQQCIVALDLTPPLLSLICQLFVFIYVTSEQMGLPQARGGSSQRSWAWPLPVELKVQVPWLTCSNS